MEQAKSRAIENHAFILRCDVPNGGISALISPDGIILAQQFGSGGSWEFEIDVENASNGRFLEGIRVKNEWIALALLSLVLIGGWAGENAIRGRKMEGDQGKNSQFAQDGMGTSDELEKRRERCIERRRSVDLVRLRIC